MLILRRFRPEALTTGIRVRIAAALTTTTREAPRGFPAPQNQGSGEEHGEDGNQPRHPTITGISPDRMMIVTGGNSDTRSR